MSLFTSRLTWSEIHKQCGGLKRICFALLALSCSVTCEALGLNLKVLPCGSEVHQSNDIWIGPVQD